VLEYSTQATYYRSGYLGYR